MPSIGDSSAVRIQGGQLPQHQSALTLLQGRLAEPAVKELTWLDLACGRGQILDGLTDSLSHEERAKVIYWAYDVDQRYAKETHRSASDLGFTAVETVVGDLQKFDDVLAGETRFDFITLTNTVHEIEPDSLARLFANSVRRLAGDGILFVYDMERVKPPELGALPWAGSDIRTIARMLVAELGAPDYHPGVGRWHHRTVDGWNLQIARKNLAVSDEELDARLPDAITATGLEIKALLGRRLADCTTTLEAFTAHGVETAEEQDDKEHLLHEYWALSRALEAAS